MHVRAKKHLGQHFLTDLYLAEKIVEGIKTINPTVKVLEIGPGKGVLTQFLLPKFAQNFQAIDIDQESIDFLSLKFPFSEHQILKGDFLSRANTILNESEWVITGNFPYNISSQIVFKILENRSQVVEMVGMFQKEVANRFRAKTSTKEYGILSVLVQAFFEVEYLFSVKPGSFFPPPKVNSGVVRFIRKDKYHLNCPEDIFFKVVKAGFNQRRKTLRNALQGEFPKIKEPDAPYFSLRAETLSVSDFVILTNFLID